MSEHFIKNIEIKNFKCFDNFKAEGFGRVNLIGGKNNVGKTAFMEACYINEQETSNAIAEIIFSRYHVELMSELLVDVGTKYVLKFLENKAKDIEGGKIISKSSTTEIKYSEKDWGSKEKISNIIYLNTSKNTNIRYDEWYSAIIENNLENNFDTLVRKFEKSIDKFRIIKSEPKCSKINNGKFYNLNEFGDGISKFIAYLSCLLTNKDGIVFIDEIENGIHYTNLDKLWEIILTISKQQNVQVFATTHSKECIESYARVAKRLEDDEIGFIELGRNKKDELDSVVMDSEMFQRFVKLGNEVRGW